jgi:hypothetical protein
MSVKHATTVPSNAAAVWSNLRVQKVPVNRPTDRAGFSLHCVPLTFPARLALSRVAFSSDSSHDRSHERAILMSTRKELFVHTEERDPHKGAMAPDMQHILADEAEINGGRRCCRSEENRGGT